VQLEFIFQLPDDGFILCLDLVICYAGPDVHGKIVEEEEARAVALNIACIPEVRVS
jgi:hypothetical protein